MNLLKKMLMNLLKMSYLVSILITGKILIYYLNMTIKINEYYNNLSQSDERPIEIMSRQKPQESQIVISRASINTDFCNEVIKDVINSRTESQNDHVLKKKRKRVVGPSGACITSQQSKDLLEKENDAKRQKLIDKESRERDKELRKIEIKQNKRKKKKIKKLRL